MSHLPQKLLSLQLLRGIASILVLHAHSIEGAHLFGGAAQAGFFNLENFGSIGVDIFFVISGAIITIICHEKPPSPGQFLAKRFIRVMPYYWIITVLTVIIRCIAYNHYSIPSPGSFARAIVLLPLFDGRGVYLPVLSVGWTLAFELLFYLVFALALYINRRRHLIISIAVFTLLIIAGFIAKSTAGINDMRVIFITNPIILEFLAGCVCGWLFVSQVKIPVAVCGMLLVLAMAIFLYNLINGYGPVHKAEVIIDGTFAFERTIRWGSGSFLLVCSLLMLEKTGFLKVPGAGVIAGDISYSTYLIHIPVIIVLRAVWGRVINGLPDLFVWTSIILCLLIAYGCWRWVERPLIDGLNKRILTRKFLRWS